jgi:5'(3')-deoxyribonucleotidase
MAPRFVLGVDLDGVVGDFYGFMRNVTAEWLDVPVDDLTPGVKWGLPEWGIKTREQYNDMHRFAVTQRGLFRKMQVIHGAAATLRRLSDADIHIRIITHRLFISHFHREAVQQTVDWLDNYGIPYRDLCFLRDKVAVGADMYIDDSPDNVEALRKGTEVPTVVFTNSTNRDLADPRADNWEQVERLVLEERERWRAKQGPDKETTGH